LGGVSSFREVDEGVTCDLVGKSSASIAKDAAFAVKMNKVGNWYWFFIVALFFHKTRLAWPISHCLILKGTLPALVAYRAIQRVVNQKKFKDSFLCSFGVL
tara:strand:- start:179 stop:481 length:303 start_codon:yes stop_codon:yes gene_type:complete